MTIDRQVTNLRIEAKDASVVVHFDVIPGADGYIISFFNEEDTERCIKRRYADKTAKTVSGFKNDTGYYASICAFVLNEDGEEICGPESNQVYFVPSSDALKAQEKICLKIGETARIEYSYQDTIPDVIFESTNPDVARVDDTGNVIAMSKGDALIVTAMDEEHFAVTSVSVDRGKSEVTTNFVNLVFTGDLMCAVRHQKMASGRSFDFTSEMKRIREKLSFADARIGVLETVVDDDWPYEYEQGRLSNGAPNCNSPSAFVKALALSGFDVLITANNHNCDAFERGLKSTINHIRQNGMTNSGTYYDNPIYLNIKGIKVAIISLCAINNGNENAVDPTPLRRDIGRYSRKLFMELVTTAKTDKADVIAVCMHWGNMNSHAVSRFQKEEAQFIADNGADIIIGSHPHLIQRAQTITASDGRNVLCAYSLGNFITTMNELDGNRDGAALVVSISKNGLQVECTYSYIPFYNTFDKQFVYISPVDIPVNPPQKKSLERIRKNIGDEVGIYRPKIACIGSRILPKILEKESLYIADTTYTGMSMADYIESVPEGADRAGDYCLVDLFTDALDEELDLQGVMPDFVRALRKRYDDRHVILLRLSFYDKCVNHDQLRNGRFSEQFNDRIKFMEQAFIELLGPCVIDISAYYFRDTSHSDMITDFEPYFYMDARNRLRDILSGSPKLYYYEPDNEIWMRRVLRYYDNMLARNYFSWFTSNDAAGMLIINTSHSFVADHTLDILRLKNYGVADLNDIDEYAYDVSDDIHTAARIIRTIDRREFLDEKDIQFLLKYEFNLRSEYAQILCEKLDYPVSVAEIADAAAHMEDRDDYVLNYAHPKANVDIWGSCITRTSVAKNPDIVIGNYVFKQPAVLANRPPLNIALPDEVTAYENNRWRMSTIQGSLEHNGMARLTERNTDWIIIDFYDLITEVLKIEDDYMEVDDFIKRTKVYKMLKPGRVTTHLCEDLPEETAVEAFGVFTDFIKEIYKDHIILVKVDCKNEYIDLDGEIRPLKEDPLFDKKREYVAKFENLFIEKTKCHVVDIAKDYMASDAFPLGGAHIVHYEDGFYSACCDEIVKIIRLKPPKK